MTMTGIWVGKGKTGRNRTYKEPMPPEMRERIEAHLAERLSAPLFLPLLAAVAGMHVPEFMDAFRAEFGISPRQYLTARRLERVQALLTSTTMSVTSIARAAGFNSVNHLTLAFKQRFGMTPSEFRYRNSA